jgi:hypothetical protein
MPAKKPLNTQPTNRLLDVSTLANSPYEKIFNPQSENIPIQQSNVFNKTSIVPQKQIQRAPSAMPNQNVVLNAGMQMLPEEQMPEEPSDDSSNFLGSLIAQGITGIGTGLMGGDSYDIMRSANVFQNMRDRQANEKRAKLLTDPKSKESESRRKAYRAVGLNVPDNLSYTDLNDPTVLQGLKGQAEQSRLSGMSRGGIGLGGSGKESKEDIKNIQSFKDATAENNKFIKQLDEYSNLVKKIPATGGTFTSGASTIESAKVLRGKLLLQLKNIEKTGALDAGMIAIADQILGTPDYTRNEVVDAKTNQLKSAIQDDILTNAEKFGITGTAVFDDGIEYYVDKNKNPVMKVK